MPRISGSDIRPYLHNQNSVAADAVRGTQQVGPHLMIKTLCQPVEI